MIKTYISALLMVFLVAVQVVHAQADVEGAMTSDAVTEAAAVSEAEQAPTMDEADKIPLLLDKGSDLYNSGEFHEAVRVLDIALSIDKYNVQAIKLRKRASAKIAASEIKKREVTRKQAMAEVTDAWSQDVVALGVVNEDQGAGVDPREQAIDQMTARLKAIIIPSLDFTDTPIEEVVLHLTESSRTLDAAGKGVNIMLVGMDEAEGERTVTTAITKINLYDALKVISEMASLKFDVKPNAIAIMPANYYPVAEMVMRSYDVLPEVGDDLESYTGDGGGVDDLFGDDTASSTEMEPVDVAGFFSVAQFPDGASATYRPRFRKLFVKNTPANLDTIEGILNDLNERAIKSRSQQVEIEAKFVEFNEGSLEEIGFDWTVYGGGSVAGFNMKPGQYYQKASGFTTANGIQPAGTIYTDPITGQQLITEPSGRTGQNVFGSGQRSNGDVGGGGIGGAFEALQSGLLSKMGGAPSAMFFGNGDIDVRLAAMEQQGKADVLSAPRITTKSGAEAVIRVAETHRYPQDYDVQTGQRTSPVIQPQDWEDIDLGVSLRVTPIVDLDSDTIDIELQPELMSFQGFDEYTVGYNSLAGGGLSTLEKKLIAKMAFFERRLISTQVTIADGYTVVMGGLVDERTETFRDQVPFLGDIPYLGRLFRTEGSRSAKRNLTIFVKAEQVDVNGMTSSERKLANQEI